MKRILLKKDLLLFVLAITLCSANAQNRVILKNNKINTEVPVLARNQKPDGNENSNLSPIPIEPSTKSPSNRATDLFYEYETMVTNYDLQTNTSLGNRIAVWADGSAAIVATMDHSGNTSFPNRGTGYNYFNGSSMGSLPTASVETIRSGWPSIAPLGNGEILASANNTGVNIYKRSTKGQGSWTSLGSFNSVFWPRIATTSNGQFVHLTFAYQDENTNEHQVYYLRSTNGGQSFSAISYPPQVDVDGEYRNLIGADDYSIATNGNKIAILFGDMDYDLFYIYSSDNGATWSKQVIWEFPYNHAFDYSQTTISSLTDSIWAPRNHSISIDNNGVVHVAFSLCKWAPDPANINTSYVYWPYTDAIIYWNSQYTNQQGGHNIPNFGNWSGDSSHPEWNNNGTNGISSTLNAYRLYELAYADGANHLNVIFPDENHDGNIDYTPYWDNYQAGYYRSHGIAATPAISVDESGRLIIAYSVLSESRVNTSSQFYYRSCLITTRDNTGNWSYDAINLSAGSAHQNDEVYSVFAAPNGKNGSFWVGYSADPNLGLYVDNYNNGVLTDNHIYAVKVSPWQSTSYCTISATVSPNNAGTVSGTGSYALGSICTLSAEANSNFAFVEWTKNGSQVSTDPTYSFTVIGNETYEAHFVSTMQYTITASADPAGSGSVSGAGTYLDGSTCTLSAVANSGYSFVRWTKNGSLASSSPTFSFTVTEDATYVAHFLSDAVSIWDGTWEPWTHGTGTEADPFLIENAKQLAYLAYRVNNGLDAGGGHVSNHDYHYKLMVDVDLNGSEDFQWTPIGYWNSDSDYQCFSGYFDGNNHTISELYINSSANRTGLFGFTNGVYLKNVYLASGNNTTTGESAGGIIGVADSNSIISNCYNSANISSASNAGGIVGWCSSGDVSGCYNTGNIVSSSNRSYSGGIIGFAEHADIRNCYNEGVLSAIAYYSSYSGGIIGCCNISSILNSYNVGSLNGSILGGIVNQYYSGSIIVTNCYYLNTCGGGNECGGEPQTETFMKSHEFVDVLNNGSCSWEQDTQPYQNQGYPILTGIVVSVSTNDATSITQSHATLHGSVQAENAFIQSQGFEYLQSGTYQTHTITVTGSGNISATLSNLEPSTTYSFRTFCTIDDCGTSYGEWKSFSTADISIITYPATNLSLSSATLNGFIDLGDLVVPEKGFKYWAVGDIENAVIIPVENNGSISTTVHGLEMNKTYRYFTFVALSDDSFYYTGETQEFELSWSNSDTILINDAEMLRWVSEQCNSGTTFEGKYIKLMNDITLPDNVPNNMTSIGVYPNHPFKGTFDGNGKLITNLYIDQPNTPYQGFFGYTLNANLYNVGLVNITASGRNYTGGMVAYAENTNMRDCYVNGGTLFALSYCGGLVGYQEQGTNSIISGCYNTCEVTGNNYVGGLIGFSNYSTVRNSYVAGMVEAQGEAVGAIIGGANEVLMYHCYFNTDLTGQTNAIGENNTGKGGGEGMSSTQMRDPQFVNTLNQGLTTPVWKRDFSLQINRGFPILQWQSGLGVNESYNIPVSLYPNPTNSSVTIEAENLRHVSIFNPIGQQIYDSQADGDVFECDLSNHDAGIYLIRLETASGIATKRLVLVK